ncbi:MAG: helicase-related protein, partial [Spirochaetota bacterium]
NTVTVDKIQQIAVETAEDAKQITLCALIEEIKPYMALIFCRTKRRAHSLNRTLKAQGLSSDEIHGDIAQTKRERVMQSFRDNKIQFLVATDVAARGIDISGITHVINYDLPHDAEGFIHRTGRTARAGKDGCAITLVTPADRSEFLKIEKAIGMTVKRRKISIENAKAIAPVKKDLPAKSYASTRPYAANATPGRNDRGTRKFAGDRRGENPYGRNARKKQGDTAQNGKSAAEKRQAPRKPHDKKNAGGVSAHAPEKKGAEKRLFAKRTERSFSREK